MPLGDLATMEEGMAFLREWETLMLHQGAPYHCHTPAGELRNDAIHSPHSPQSDRHEWMP